MAIAMCVWRDRPHGIFLIFLIFVESSQRWFRLRLRIILIFDYELFLSFRLRIIRIIRIILIFDYELYELVPVVSALDHS